MSTTSSSSPIPSAQGVRDRLAALSGQRRALAQQQQLKMQRRDEMAGYLALAPAVEQALDALSRELFGKMAETIEHYLTLALQEVLAQPIKLRVSQEFKRGSATLDLFLERDGKREDIMKGTGGSVTNILSVGLRLFALAQLDEKEHRRFLVLDEQDCWLAPELVPRLVKIVHDAGKALGFQVVMISHHSPAAFEQYADRIYRFVPTGDAVSVEMVRPPPGELDQEI